MENQQEGPAAKRFSTVTGHMSPGPTYSDTTSSAVTIEESVTQTAVRMHVGTSDSLALYKTRRPTS
jgi:hypothetical protein